MIQVPVSVLTSRSPCLQKYSFNEALISLFYNIPAGKKILFTELGGAPVQIFSPVVIYKCLFLKDQLLLFFK